MDLSERPAGTSSSERRHPWEVARFSFFSEVLRALPVPPARILDAGAGDGWFSAKLAGELPPSAGITCWDAHYTPEVMAALASHAGANMRFVAERPKERFDLLLLLDVLEHVEDDDSFLRTLVEENLEEGAAVLISVPAWQQLFTSHDTRLRHFRRYSPRRASSVITNSGLRIQQRGGAFHSLLLPRALAKALELLRLQHPASAPPSLDWNGGPRLTAAVGGLLAADGELSRATSRLGLELPGLSWWALCRKP